MTKYTIIKNKLKPVKEKHYKLAWVCDECGWLQVSDTKEHHQMDYCKCGKCSVDLEEYMCRFSGFPRVISKKLDGKKWRLVRR